MLLLVPVALLLFAAPGYFLSRLLGSRAPGASTFLLALLVLFHAAFLLGIVGLPVTLWTAGAVLLGVTGAAALAARRWAPPAPTADKSAGPPPLARAVLVGVGLVLALLLLRCALMPLTGYDTHWRWDFLAQRIRERGNFDFYPPRSPRDYSAYFYAEAIPPLVSFSYWWLYAAAGRHAAELTALPVVAQYAAVAALTYRTGAALFSKRAGLFAVVALATSLLFFRAVAIGQETGLTALSMTALVYFIVSAGERPDYRAMVLAGLSAALGALAREYGWAFVGCGLLVLGWRKRGWKEAAVFGATALLVAGPWYVRTFVLTGNPLFSNRLLGLPVNPVHAAIIDSYREQLGVGTWSAARWRDYALFLLAQAPLQLLLGVPGAVVIARRHGYLGLSALLVVVLGLSSMGYTSGGARYASRVLAPALVLLSLTAAALLDRLRPRPAQTAVALLLAVLLARAAAYAAIFPGDLDRPASPFSREPNAPVPADREELLPGLLAGKLPAGARVLAESAYSHAALAGTGYDVVPVWGPEVAFLFDPNVSADEARRRLWDHGVRAVIYNPDNLNALFLRRESPFFRDAPAGWKPLVALEGTETVVYELPPPK